MKSVILTSLILLFGIQNAFAKNQCFDVFDQQLPKLSSSSVKVIESVGKFIEKNGDLPTKTELISLTKLSKEKYDEVVNQEDIPSNMRGMAELAKLHFPHYFKKGRSELVKKYAVFIKDHLRTPTNAEIAELLETSTNKLSLLYGPIDHAISRAESDFPKFIDAAKKKIILGYAKTAKELGRTPTLEEVADSLEVEYADFKKLISKDGLFRSEEELLFEAQVQKPSAFRDVIDTKIFNDDRLSAMTKAIEVKDVLLVTTAVAGAPVDKPFFDSLLKYAREHNGAVLVFPANMQTHGLDPIFLETPDVHIVSNSVELSKHIKLNNIKITAKQINPLTGLDEIGRRNQVQIVGSPKMHMRSVATLPTENLSNPHQLITTGAVTRPNYNGKKYIQARTDGIAGENHVLGALLLQKSKGDSDIFEGDSSGFFHYRHVEYIPEKKGFVDLNKLYTADTVQSARPEAVVLGDIHVGETDSRILNAFIEQIVTLNPKKIILHDLFNGHSISHHEADKLISMAQKAERGELDLKKELNEVATFLNTIMSVAKDTEIMIISSNHNSWIDRWLQDGRFMQEHHNTEIGIEMARLAINNINPLEHALVNGIKTGDNKLVHGIEKNFRNRIEFSREGESFKVGPDHRLVELGVHGHAGANGARGSLQSFRKGVDRIVYGHTHTEERKNGTVNIGTFTELILPYNKDGLSNWVQSLGVVGQNGEIQALRFKDGEWFAPLKAKKVKNFFQPNYPLVVKQEFYGDEGQIDQYQ